MFLQLVHQDFLLSDPSTWIYSIDPYQALIDVLLLVFSIYVIFKRPQKPEKPFSEEEIQDLIDEWQPDPLIPELTPIMELDAKIPVISSSTSTTHVTIEGKQVLNLARFNFLGFTSNPRIEEASTQALYKYGVGTCGPRQFYGTIDKHLHLETRIKQFMKTEDSILFSYGVATSSSSIPAFAGRDDLLIVDKGISIGMQIGVNLSRSEVIWYEHNDMADLERILKKVENETRNKKRKLTRRFIVFEGVAFNYGDIAPLPKIVDLKHRYKYRLIMEDSGIGNLGKTGRGVVEHFNIDISEIEILTGNLEHICGSVGGFCVGKSNIVFHQRLNSNGYVYSASLPPLLAVHAQTALDMIDEQPELLSQFREKIEFFYAGLQAIPQLKIRSSILAPVIHIEFAHPPENRHDNERQLQDLVDAALAEGVLLTRAKYTTDERHIPAPSIRICVCAAMKKEDLTSALDVIRRSSQFATSRLTRTDSLSKDIMKRSKSALQL